MDKHASPGFRRYLVAPLPLLLAALPTLRTRCSGVAAPRDMARHALALMYAFTASTHFTGRREDLVRTMPPWMPAPRQAVATTGALELLGATALLMPATAPLAGRGQALLLVALFPANVRAARRGVPLEDKPATPPGIRRPAGAAQAQKRSVG